MPPQQRAQRGDIVSFDEVLAIAHNRGLASIATKLVQEPAESNGWTAIFQATAALKDGLVVQAHGDATKSEASQVQGRWLALAETRAVKRCLLWLTNTPSSSDAPEGRRSAPRPQQRPHAEPPQGPATAAQVEAIQRLLVKNHGMAPQDTARWIAESAEIKSMEQLTAAQAARLITHLQDNKTGSG